MYPERPLSWPHDMLWPHLLLLVCYRPFRLRLRRNAAVFSPSFTVINESGPTFADVSHIYSGTLEGVLILYSHQYTCMHVTMCLMSPLGERGSSCHGSVIHGQFEGSIHTANGTYHIEPTDRYTSIPTDHHSIIYHEDDMGKTFCFFFFSREVKTHWQISYHRQLDSRNDMTQKNSPWVRKAMDVYEVRRNYLIWK